jgi:hypothetical protein
MSLMVIAPLLTCLLGAIDSGTAAFEALAFSTRAFAALCRNTGLSPFWSLVLPGFYMKSMSISEYCPIASPFINP